MFSRLISKWSRGRTVKAESFRAAASRPLTEPLEGRVLLSSDIYVDINASGDTHDGLGWNTAYVDLQQGLAAATAGDRILVAEGTYKPTATTDRTLSFLLKTGVTLEGGYAGASDPASRDITLYPTILSGDIGAAGDNTDNTYHVVVGNDTTSTAILDGFTISGGKADGNSYPNDRGGGVLNLTGNPTISNCTFTGNSASYYGGGMHNESSSPTLINCVFSGNTSQFGGAIVNYSSAPTLSNCTFFWNSANSYGGGIYDSSSSPSLTNCTFNGNLAPDVSGYGGGMYNDYSSSPSLTNCTFSVNVAGYSGGGMYNASSSDPVLINNTFSGNRAGDAGGGIYNDSSSPTLTNCLVWGNVAPNGPQLVGLDSTPVVTYSDIQGGWSGTGNLNSNPIFVRIPGAGTDGKWGTSDDDYGDLRLQSLSPCIDAGSNAAVPAGVTTDLAGNARTQNSTVDLGAYESAYVALPRLSINAVAVKEGNSGTTKMTFTVTLSPASNQTVTVYFATANGTAVVNSDFLAASGTLTFTPGQTSKTIQVLVKGNTIIQPNRTLLVNLSTPTNATIAVTQGVGTITDDDTYKFSVSVATPPVTIKSGQPAVLNFGSARVGVVGASKVFRVTNTGTASLTLGKVLIPAGYQLVKGLATTLAPGASDTFTLKLLTKKPGKYTGAVSFTNNTAAKTFRFSVTGTVVATKA